MGAVIRNRWGAPLPLTYLENLGRVLSFHPRGPAPIRAKLGQGGRKRCFSGGRNGGKRHQSTPKKDKKETPSTARNVPKKFQGRKKKGGSGVPRVKGVLYQAKVGQKDHPFVQKKRLNMDRGKTPAPFPPVPESKGKGKGLGSVHTRAGGNRGRLNFGEKTKKEKGVWRPGHTFLGRLG